MPPAGLNSATPDLTRLIALSATACGALLTSAPALAAEAGSAVPSAFAAYGHYLGLLAIAMALVTQRLCIKPGMSEEDFALAVKADIAYTAAAVLVLVSGYARVAAYGKGFEFYAHEPVFWLKMLLFGVMGASSLFPKVKLAQRAVAEGRAEVAMLSPKLTARMTSVINAQILAVLAIPLTASLMARGVGYADWLPWQAGAAPALLATAGLSVKYVKEALSWSDDE
jgi:uncharacterized membrane protein